MIVILLYNYIALAINSIQSQTSLGKDDDVDYDYGNNMVEEEPQEGDKDWTADDISNN